MTTPPEAPPQPDLDEIVRALARLEEGQREMRQDSREFQRDTSRRFDQANQRMDEFQRDIYQRMDQNQRDIYQRMDEFQRDTNRRFDQVTQRTDRLFYAVIASGAAVVIALTLNIFFG